MQRIGSHTQSRFSVGNAKALETARAASNGIIHVIDTMRLPD